MRGNSIEFLDDRHWKSVADAASDSPLEIAITDFHTDSVYPATEPFFLIFRASFAITNLKRREIKMAEPASELGAWILNAGLEPAQT